MHIFSFVCVYVPICHDKCVTCVEKANSPASESAMRRNDWKLWQRMKRWYTILQSDRYSQVESEVFLLCTTLAPCFHWCWRPFVLFLFFVFTFATFCVLIRQPPTSSIPTKTIPESMALLLWTKWSGRRRDDNIIHGMSSTNGHTIALKIKWKRWHDFKWCCWGVCLFARPYDCTQNNKNISNTECCYMCSYQLLWIMQYSAEAVHRSRPS